jgi:hypothetical protein
MLPTMRPKTPQLSKEELRRQGEEAVKQFEAKRQHATDVSWRRAESAPGIPPWEEIGKE